MEHSFAEGGNLMDSPVNSVLHPRVTIMQRFISSRIVAVSLLLLSIQASAAKAKDVAKDFSGQWETTYGLMTLEQKGDSVSGHYIMGGAPCSIDGKVQNQRLEFKYQEPNASGEG